MSYKNYAIIAIIFLSWYSLYSQNDFEIEYPVPLTQKSYEELKDLFYEVKVKDTLLAESYAEAFLKKAKREGDTLKMAKGYKYFYFISKDSLALKYADSIIYITKEIDNKHYPALGYMYKAYTLYNKGDYLQSLDNCLAAHSYALKRNNIDQLLSIQQSMASLKNRWGAYDEALVIYKDYLQHVKKQKNYKVTFAKDYTIGLYNLSLSYLRNKKPDSAYIYIKEGIKESLKVKDSSLYYKFVLTSGTSLYEKEKYIQALDSLNKAIPHINNTSLAISYLYKGEILLKLNEIEQSVKYLKKVDSIFQETNDIFPELPEAYHVLIKYYKKKNDKENQLKYIDKLLYADSLIDKNYLNINKVMKVKYDLPLIISEKEKIINQLKTKQSKSYKLIYLFIIIIMISTLLLIIYLIKHRNNKKILEDLLNNYSNLTEHKTNTSISSNKKQELDIDNDTVNEILINLEKFESEIGYIELGISLSSLSKDFGTNSAYLSKVINVYKNKNFANYLNDLRIDYAIKKIKTDIKLQSFTIKAISEEMGFSTPQSFATAFYKRTGIYPSYFIRELKKLKPQKN